MENNSKNKNNLKNKLLIISVLILVIVCIIIGVAMQKYKNTLPVDNGDKSQSSSVTENENSKKQTQIDEKVDIIDINSNSRPYAVVVNNTAVAVKVQEGLNDAYLVYEIPTEGNTSRLLALYKDVDKDLTIGTVRSARHNFVDFALESDAIFCCYGWSHYAEADLKSGSIDYFQGLFGGPYYRNNPENLASEHTAYTNINKLNNSVESKGMRKTSNGTILLKYNTGDEDLSLAQDSKVANTVTIPYGYSPQIASFKYNEESKMYTRYEDNNKCVDYKTKEEITTKNIIVQKVEYKMCDDNYYWDLDTIGSGEGYYITNGYSVPIIWDKKDRSSKTKYIYKDGTIIDGKDVGGQEISVSDGRTWIEVQTTEQKITIE